MPHPTALLLVLLATQTLVAAPPAAPTRLRIDDVADPVGTGAAPHFGWLVHDPDPDEIQTRYQIQVAETAAALAAAGPLVWDSGEVADRSQNHLVYAGPALRPDTRYFWRVRTWDRDGQAGPFSTPAAFVVGPLANADWSGAQWIHRDTGDTDDYTRFRKTFTLPAKPVARATIYLTGVHKYALYVNGALVGKGPAYHYPQHQYYNAWDITPLLAAGGPNLLAVANHWFGGGQGRPTSARGILARLVVHFADGTTATVGTDATWKQRADAAWIGGQRPRDGEGVGYVERFDARLAEPGWTEPTFDDSGWGAATVVGPQPTAPWTGTPAPDLSRIDEHEVAPVAVQDLGAGSYLVDFGRVYAGVPRIAFPGGPAGAEVQLLGGYVLDATGRIDPRQNQHTDLSWQVVLGAEPAVFTGAEYFGFRYLQIDHAPAPLRAEDCRLVVRHTRFDTDAATFASDNPALDATWQLMRHTLTVSMQEQFVDTPTREKGAFLGDSIFQSSAAMPALHDRVLTRRALGEFIQSMDQYWSAPADRGRINAVYPNVDGARDIPDNTLAFPVWAWNYYLASGDRAFLEFAFPYLKDVADYAWRSRDETTGLVTNLPGGRGPYAGGIIDWPPTMRYGYDARTAARTVVHALACADQDYVARVATELGRTADADSYGARANELRTALTQRLLRPDDGVYVDGLHADGTASTHVSQQANSVPLAFGLVPETQRATVLAKVEELQMRSGMETILWLVRALGDAGAGDQLVELYTNPDQPGWARCLARGATTTWESWDADATGNSRSHGWGAAGLEGYVRYLLGVLPLRPQYEEVRIAPLHFGPKLTHVRGTVPTDRGTIAVEWQRTADEFLLRATIPVNITAEVLVPARPGAAITLQQGAASPVPIRPLRFEAGSAVLRVGSGTYAFRVGPVPTDG